MAEGQTPTTTSSTSDTPQSNKMIRSRFVRPKPNLMGTALRNNGTTPQTPPNQTPPPPKPVLTTPNEPETSKSSSTITNLLPAPSLPAGDERISLGSPPPITRSVPPEPKEPIITKSREVKEREAEVPITPLVVTDRSSDGSSTSTFEYPPLTTPADALPTTSTRPNQATRTTVARTQISSRRRQIKKQSKPEKDKMTMQDLIYWNPGGSPMKYDSEEARVPLSNVETNSSVGLNTESLVSGEESVVDDPGVEADSITPQLKIGPDGNIVFDEKSLVIETSASKNNLSNSPVVHENLMSNKTYASFRKYKPSAKWTDKQTAKFYLALSAVGTDFSMMSDLFPKRTRHELKLKYKREERLNRALVDKAIGERQQFDFSLFNDVDDEEELENELLTAVVKKSKQKCKSRRAQTKGKRNPLPRRSRSRVDSFNEQDDYDEDDEMEIEESGLIDEVSISDADDDVVAVSPTNDEDREEDEVIDGLLKRTRSGRQPKKNAVYNVSESEKRRRTRKRPPPVTSITSSSPLPPDPPNTTTAASTEEEEDGLSTAEPTIDSPSHLLLVAEKPSESGSQVVHVLVYSPRGLAANDLNETRVYTEMAPVPPVVEGLG